MTSAPSRCHQCKGKDFETDEGRVERQVGEFSFGADLSLYRCISCKEEIFALQEIGKFEKEITGWLAREGILSGEAFRFMRKSLRLKANELAQLLDVTPETISRWEKEHRPPDRKAMMVLGSMVLDSLRGENTTLLRLRSLGSAHKENGPIDLTSSLQAA